MGRGMIMGEEGSGWEGAWGSEWCRVSGVEKSPPIIKVLSPHKSGGAIGSKDNGKSQLLGWAGWVNWTCGLRFYLTPNT